jgi:hypothetical protein
MMNNGMIVTGLRLALAKAPNRVGVSFPLPESYFEFQTMEEVHKPRDF